MSKFKGTPGPWHPAFNRDSEDGVNATSIYSEDGIYVADVYRGYVGSEDLKEVEQKANARLIAAAPELLEALDDLIHLAESAMLRANYDGGEYDIDGELSDARAAIAKALGEDAP